MKKNTLVSVFTVVLVIAFIALKSLSLAQTANEPQKITDAQPSLTVQLMHARKQAFDDVLVANGSLAPWQLAVVSAEYGGARLEQILVEVGDHVQKGQLLAKFNPIQAQVDLEGALAQVAEAQASLAEASVNAERAKKLQKEGFYSLANLTQFLTAEDSAQARLKVAQAHLVSSQRALKETEVRAPDAGVISKRNALVGAVYPLGAELFQLIRQSRLEWQAELTQNELMHIKPGQTVVINQGSGKSVIGKVRKIDPTLATSNRTGIVYVEIDKQAMALGLRAGAFVQGTITLSSGTTDSLAIPNQALLFKDGFRYVFSVSSKQGDIGIIAQKKVETGRMKKINGQEWVEILSGINDQTELVASGVVFLSDNDHVKIVQTH